MTRHRLLCVSSLFVVASAGCEEKKAPAPEPTSKPSVVKPAATARAPASASGVASASAPGSASPVAPAPQLLSEGLGTGKVIAVFGEHVYWVVRPGASCTEGDCKAAADGRILRIPKEGGVSKEIVGSLANVTSMASDNKNLYWTMCGTADYVQRCQVTAAPFETGKRKTLFDAGPDLVDFVAWTGDKVVWAEPGKQRVQALGAENKPVTLVATGDVTDVEVRDGIVYWSEGRVTEAAGAVKKLESDKSEPVSLASKRRFPKSLCVDAEHAYWVESVESEAGSPALAVMRVPLAGGEPKPVAEGLTYVDDIARAGNAVIVVTSDAVLSYPKAGGKPVTLAQNQKSPHGPATDDTHVFWLADNKVWRAELPK